MKRQDIKNLAVHGTPIAFCGSDMVKIPFKELLILYIKMEEYKKVFEDYEISNLGNCRKLLKNGSYSKVEGSIQNRGYRYLQINRNKKRTNLLFHHLVAKAFLGERPEGLVIDHIDRDKLNNNVSNLRYISFVDNLRNCDRYRDDIKEADKKKRHNIMTTQTRKKVKENETFICLTCPLIYNLRGGSKFGSKRDYDVHHKGTLHLQRLNVIEQMRKHNIEPTPENYKKIKHQNDDYRRGRRKIKPLVLINN